MVGRGAIGKPWIFKLMKDYIIDGLEEQKLYSNLIYEVVIEHFNQMINYYGEYGVILFRKHLHTYSKGIDGASEFRQFVNSIKDKDILRDKIKEFFLKD